MGWISRGLARYGQARVDAYRLPVVPDLDRGGVRAHINPLPDQGMRRRVSALIVHDVIVWSEEQLTPDLEEGERLRLERPQRRTVQLLEQSGARLSRRAPQRLGVEADEQAGQQGVHLTE